jgi:UDP-glucose 4-epimerase
MGMSKALMEKLVRSNAYNGPVRSCITRYGNVIGSRGSVIPYFIEQVKTEKPIKVTDWSMTRFVMSLEESVALVLQALSSGSQGDLFVRKAPSASLDKILTTVEILLGKKAKSVIVAGVRPGEKIHETLLNSEEKTYAVEESDYYKVPSVAIGSTANKARLLEEFRSDNSSQLSVDDLTKILLSDPEIQSLI